jgi:integrase/recombinase XerD
MESREAMLTAFEQSLKARGVRTHQAALARLEAFLGFLAAEGLSWERVRECHAAAYAKALLEAGRNRRTVNNALATLRVWGRWLSKSARCAHNPLREVESLHVGPWMPKNVLGIEETGAFFASFRLRTPRDLMAKALLELLYGSGIRISEAVALKEQHLDLKGLTATIYEAKTGKERRVPLTEAFAHSLSRYYEDARETLTSAEDKRAGFVFPQKGSTTLRARLNALLARECARLRLPKLSSHSMRHMAATHLLKKGAGIRQVQAFLGHESIGTTQGYARVCKEDLKRVIEACHPMEALHVD